MATTARVRRVTGEAAEHGPGAHRVDLAQGHPDPRPRRVAQDVEELAPGDPIRGDPVEGGRGEAGASASAAARRPASRRTSASSPRSIGPVGDLEGERLGAHLVLEEGRGERQRDPARQAAGAAGKVAIHDFPGQGPAGRSSPLTPKRRRNARSWRQRRRDPGPRLPGARPGSWPAR